MADPIIEFRDADKWFGAFQALRGVHLAVPAGAVAVVCGPSGSGKSTLLRCISGLERIDGGELTVMGRAIRHGEDLPSAFRADVGMVFQRFSLYPHMSVLRNLTLAPVRVRALSRRDAEARAMELLERVGLADKAASYPSELSGGQSQRAAIARALIMGPRILLFDEPTSALDPEMIREVLDVMRDLARSGMTMIVVTHEMGFAREVSDRVVFMDHGAIVEDATSAEFFTQARTERAQRFLDTILHH